MNQCSHCNRPLRLVGEELSDFVLRIGDWKGKSKQDYTYDLLRPRLHRFRVDDATGYCCVCASQFRNNPKSKLVR